MFPLIDLAGSIALLLWGTHMVQTGVQRAFGSKLRSILGSALRNRFRALLAGVSVTAVLQSSTATGLMTAGFAAGGLVGLVPALAVMLGANIGTTLIVQVLSFNVGLISPALILIGMLMFRRDSRTQAHDLGRVFIGLGLMLLGLHQLLDFTMAYEKSPIFEHTVERCFGFMAFGRMSSGFSDMGGPFERRRRPAHHVVGDERAWFLPTRRLPWFSAQISAQLSILWLRVPGGEDLAAKRLPLAI